MKKILSLVLVASMMLTTLVACGGANKAADNTFNIGATGPITGDAAYYGTEVKQGCEIAVKEINEKGGINGAQIDFQFQDDEHNIEKSVNAYNALKDWGVDVIIGATTSDPCIAMVGKSSADNMFQLTPSGSAVDCANGKNAFQVCFSDPNQGQASAQYIAENALAANVAVIYDSSTSYSSGIYESFAKEAADCGLNIVATESFTAETSTDFSVQLQAIKSAGAELIFLPIYYKEACIILKQAADAQMDVKFFGCDGLDGILGVDGFDTSLAEGVMLLTPFAADDTAEATQSFVKKYEEAYGVKPSQFAADAYDAVYTIKAAAEAANVTTDMTPSAICDALAAAMLTISVEGITSVEGTPLTWDETGMVTKAPKAVVIENGAYKAM